MLSSATARRFFALPFAKLLVLDRVDAALATAGGGDTGADASDTVDGGALGGVPSRGEDGAGEEMVEVDGAIENT